MTRVVFQVRCSGEQLGRWKALGGSRWARGVLDLEAGLAERAESSLGTAEGAPVTAKTTVAARSASPAPSPAPEPELGPVSRLFAAVATVTPEKPARSSTGSGAADHCPHNRPWVVCMNPACKDRRGRL